MGSLPPEVLQTILSFASFDDLLVARTVCKQFAALIDSDYNGMHILRSACERAEWCTMCPLPDNPFLDGDSLVLPPVLPSRVSPWLCYGTSRRKRYRKVFAATAKIQSCIMRDMYFMPPQNLLAGCSRNDLIDFEKRTGLCLSAELKAWFASDSGMRQEHRLGRPLSKIGISDALRIWDWMQSYDGAFTVVREPATGQVGGTGLKQTWIPYMANADWREVWCVANDWVQCPDGRQRHYQRKVKYFAETNTWVLAGDDFSDDYVQLANDWEAYGMFRALSMHGLLAHMDSAPGALQPGRPS